MGEGTSLKLGQSEKASWRKYYIRRDWKVGKKLSREERSLVGRGVGGEGGM